VEGDRSLEEFLEALPICEPRERIDRALAPRFLELCTERSHSLGKRDKLTPLIPLVVTPSAAVPLGAGRGARLAGLANPITMIACRTRG